MQYIRCCFSSWLCWTLWVVIKLFFFCGNRLILTAQVALWCPYEHTPSPVYWNKTLIKPFCKQAPCLCASTITSNLILSVLIWGSFVSRFVQHDTFCGLDLMLQLWFRKPKPEFQTPSAYGTTAQFGSACSFAWGHSTRTNTRGKSLFPLLSVHFLGGWVDQLLLQAERSQALNLNELVRNSPCFW